ncbi:MAG: DMT family transporter [Alteromonas sp.]|uniref:EamA family transporter n=1 Tax=Alteromonas sp. TaxID=232 RepID=UPI0032D92E7B
MSATSRQYLIAVTCVFIAMITIQSGASLAKQLFQQVGVLGTITYRVGFAALILCFVFKPWRNRPEQLKSIIIYGLCLGGMNTAFYFAIERIPIGIAVALEFVGPLMVAILSSKKSVDFLWAVMAIMGLVLLLPDLSAADGLDPLGFGLALSAGACWAGYILFGKRTGEGGSSGAIVALGMLVAAAAIVPFGIAIHFDELMNVALIPAGIGIALLSSALPYSLEMIALRKMPSQSFSILMSIEPAIAALAGFIILGELLTLWHWLAIALVISASVGTAATHNK